MAGLEAVSAVQQGRVGGIAEGARNPLRTFPRAARQTKIQARLAQHCVAQRVVPWLCRLHGDGAIPKRNRAPARRCCGSRPDRHHVRGSSLVALPSFAYRGLPQSARGGSAARSRRKQSRAASVHIGGADCERRVKLPARVALVTMDKRNCSFDRKKRRQRRFLLVPAEGNLCLLRYLL